MSAVIDCWKCDCIIYLFQGQAICQLCKTVEDVTVYGTASYYKHEFVKESVTHLFDRVVDYSQEVRK